MNDVATFVETALDTVASSVSGLTATDTPAWQAALEHAAKLVESSASHFSLDEDPGSVRYDWSIYLAGAIRRLADDIGRSKSVMVSA